MSSLETKFWNGFGVALQPLLKVADDTGVLGRVPIPPTELPCPHPPMAPTSTVKVDEILHGLSSHKQQWARTSTTHRAHMLTEVMRNCIELAPKLARAGTQAKGSFEAGDGEDM